MPVWEDLVLLFYQRDVQKLLMVASEKNLQRCDSALRQFVSWELWLHYTAISLWSTTLGTGRTSSFSFCRLLLPHWKTCSWQCQQEPQEPQHRAVPWMQSYRLSLRPEAQGLHFSPGASTHRSLLAQVSQPDPLLSQLASDRSGHPWIIFIHPKGTMLLRFIQSEGLLTAWLLPPVCSVLCDAQFKRHSSFS